MLPKLSKLEFELLRITLELYSNPAVPRNLINFFMTFIISFVCESFYAFVMEQMKSSPNNHTDSVFSDLEKVFKGAKLSFEKFETENNRFNMYKKCELMKDSIEYNIGHTYSQGETGIEKKKFLHIIYH